jgi:hypothetical protein
MSGDKEIKIKWMVFVSFWLVILTIMILTMYNRLFNINVIKSNKVIVPIIDIRGNDTTFIYRGYDR